MKWLQKTAVISCAVGVLASFATMVPTSHSTEAAIVVFDAKNIEEAIKIAIFKRQCQADCVSRKN